MDKPERKRKPILDESGKVRQWLVDGRGVAVWVSHDIGANRPDMLTPGDAPKPHWAYEKDCTLTSESECLFYAPGCIVKSWRDTPQGYKAAHKYLASLPDEHRDAPIGRVYTTYTFHAYEMGSITIRPESEGGTVLQTYGPNASLVDVEFRVGIRQWTAIDKEDN